ncbi:MAG: 50S ribosomal protein L25 [Nitriliruptorales bacterium]|nr:50S ribosomal protein L25 [Nitriliruptorales bacterium]
MSPSANCSTTTTNADARTTEGIAGLSATWLPWRITARGFACLDPFRIQECSAMSRQVALAAHPRRGNGKGEARSLRREGRVPAIAYGADLDPTPISVDALELYHALHTDAGSNAILRLEVGGDPHLAMAREIQRHPLRREVLHVDFVTVSRNVRVAVDVPINLEGAEDAPGVGESGIISQELYALPLDVLPLEVPDSITLDVSGMNVGDTLRVSDLAVPDGVNITIDPETTVATCVVPALDVPEPETTEEALEGEAGEEAEGATGEEAEAAESGEADDSGDKR